MAEQMTDWDILSAYLDGELSETEQDALATRLQNEPELAAEYAEMQVIVASLRQMPILKAPRNYTLDPAVYGKPKTKVIRFDWRIGLSLAAAMMIVLFGVVYFTQTQADQTSETVGMGAPMEESILRQDAELTPTEGRLESEAVENQPSATNMSASVEVAIAPSPTILEQQSGGFLPEGTLQLEPSDGVGFLPSPPLTDSTTTSLPTQPSPASATQSNEQSPSDTFSAAAVPEVAQVAEASDETAETESMAASEMDQQVQATQADIPGVVQEQGNVAPAPEMAQEAQMAEENMAAASDMVSDEEVASGSELVGETGITDDDQFQDMGRQNQKLTFIQQWLLELFQRLFRFLGE